RPSWARRGAERGSSRAGARFGTGETGRNDPFAEVAGALRLGPVTFVALQIRQAVALQTPLIIRPLQEAKAPDDALAFRKQVRRIRPVAGAPPPPPCPALLPRYPPPPSACSSPGRRRCSARGWPASSTGTPRWRWPGKPPRA